MGEHRIDGGYFGDSDVVRVPSSQHEFVVHGGFFGGVPVLASERAPNGWGGDEDDLLVDCLESFATPAEYQPAGGNPALLRYGAVFRAQHTEVAPGGEVTITTDQPTAGIRRADIPRRWTERDLMICRDRQGYDRLFRVDDVQDDGEVGARVRLHEVVA